MEEHDDWKLGDDDGEPPRCPRCGKINRPGLKHCIVCGSPLAEEIESDPGSLRTLGEAMGGRRVRRAPARHSLRAWVIAAGVLLLVVAVLAWLQTREEPFRLQDWLAPAPTATATPLPLPTVTAVATRVPTPTKRPVATPTETEPPPEPTATRTAVPTPRRTPVRSRAVAPPAPPARPAQAAPPPEAAPPDDRPRVEATEKPNLGSDLQDATRAYREAIDRYNARVDEYNALADEVQRRNAWDDSEASVELRRRLDRAREAVETARVQAEMLRARMESVRTRYR